MQRCGLRTEEGAEVKVMAKKMMESKETPADEARAHGKGFLKKAARMAMKKRGKGRSKGKAGRY